LPRLRRIVEVREPVLDACELTAQIAVIPLAVLLRARRNELRDAQTRGPGPPAEWPW